MLLLFRGTLYRQAIAQELTQVIQEILDQYTDDGNPGQLYEYSKALASDLNAAIHLHYEVYANIFDARYNRYATDVSVDLSNDGTTLEYRFDENHWYWENAKLNDATLKRMVAVIDDEARYPLIHQRKVAAVSNTTIQALLQQVRDGEFYPLTASVWETLQWEGWPEEIGLEDRGDFEMLALSVPRDLRADIKEQDDDTLEFWNEFDIELKDRFPQHIDLIDDRDGSVTIVKPKALTFRTAKLATDVDVLTSSLSSVLRRHERAFRKTNLEVASYELARDLNAVVAKQFVGPAFRPFAVTSYSTCSLQVGVRGPRDTKTLAYVPKGCPDGPVGWSLGPDDLVEILMQHDAKAAKRHNAAEAFLAAVLHDSQDAGFEAVPKARASVQVLFPGDVYATFDYLDAKTVHLTYFIAYSPAKGSGGATMQFITDLADQHCCTLSLTADPLDLSQFAWPFAKMNTRAKPIPVEKLRRFYERFGFRSYRGGKDFVRTPRC